MKKMECNRLEGSEHEGKQGSRNAVRSSRLFEKGRKRLHRQAQGNLRMAGPDSSLRLKFLDSRAFLTVDICPAD